MPARLFARTFLPSMRTYLPPRGLIVLCLCLLWGCYAMSTLQEPQTLAPGKVRVTPQVRLAAGSFSKGREHVGPALDVTLRVGVYKRLEFQVGGYSFGGRVGVKALLVDWNRLKLSVVPTYQFQHMVEDQDSVGDEDSTPPSYYVRTAIVPLIAGISLNQYVDLLLGFDVHAGRRHTDRPGQSGPVLAFGGHLGVALHGPYGHGTVVPQCGVLVNTLSAPSQPYADYGRFDTMRRGDVRYECALGVSLGSRYVAQTR